RERRILERLATLARGSDDLFRRVAHPRFEHELFNISDWLSNLAVEEGREHLLKEISKLIGDCLERELPPPIPKPQPGAAEEQIAPGEYHDYLKRWNAAQLSKQNCK